jgi:hypothetical protein
MRLLLVGSTKPPRADANAPDTPTKSVHLRLLAQLVSGLLGERNQLLAHQVWPFVDDEV